MKTAVVFVICVVGLAAAVYLPLLDPETCKDHNNVPGLHCDFIPPGCLWPVCATNRRSAPIWFKSGCHLSAYNRQCRDRYYGTYEALCPADSRLEPQMPCPIY